MWTILRWAECTTLCTVSERSHVIETSRSQRATTRPTPMTRLVFRQTRTKTSSSFWTPRKRPFGPICTIACCSIDAAKSYSSNAQQSESSADVPGAFEVPRIHACVSRVDQLLDTGFVCVEKNGVTSQSLTDILNEFAREAAFRAEENLKRQQCSSCTVELHASTCRQKWHSYH